jgi:hypothetical protein
MKARLLGALCTTLILSFLWIVTAAGQSDIVVSGESAKFSPTNYGAPSTEFTPVLQRVAQRIAADYSSATVVQTLVDLSTEMRTALGNVTPRVSSDYASASQSTTLTFPKALINDQVAPQLVGTVTVLPGSVANAVRLRWQVNEFAKSTLQYGTAPGSYAQTITIDSYETTSSVEVPNLSPNTTYFGRITLTDRSDKKGQSVEFTFSLDTTPGKSLVLIYAVLDNNLGDDTEQWQRLVTNVETGAANGNIDVRLLIDSPGANNAYVYALTGGAPCITPTNPTCNGRYVENTNFWRVDEDTAHPQALYDFVNDAITAHSDASQLILSLVGHGSGWTANALPSQPSSWADQPSRSGTNTERLGGLLWDDTTGGNSGTRALSTKALGTALRWINNSTGRKIDLLYLDACSMGMAEVADEIAPAVDYLLASPNTAWASFAYDAMLTAITPGLSTEQIGRAWLDAEKAALDGGNPDGATRYPYTLALYRLDQIDGLTTAVGGLATALNSAVSGQRAAIDAALTAVTRYESNYDGAINRSDHYGDLGSFVVELQSRAGSNQALVTAINNVQSALNNMVIVAAFHSGVPHTNPDQQWAWPNAKGLGIYLPRANDPKRTLYTGDNLRWVQRSGWHQFLEAMGMVMAADAMGTELPTCAATAQCAGLPRQLPVENGGVEIYLPLIRR